MAPQRTISGHAAKQRLPAYVNMHTSLPLESQQKILDVFVRACLVEDQDCDLKTRIQEVKTHLYNRNFQAAFGKLEYLEAYAVRWSAARALAYTDIFMCEDRNTWLAASLHSPKGHYSTLTATPEGISATESLSVDQTAPYGVQPDGIKVICVGGGAGAEIVALAGTTARKFPCQLVDVNVIDIADWTQPVQQLYSALSTPPVLSVHASKAIRDANKPLINPANFRVTFLQKDILDPSTYSHMPMIKESQPLDNDDDDDDDGGGEALPTVNPHMPSQDSLINFTAADLVTLMFTLNELFATSLSKTTAFLLWLSDTMRQGSHLVVVDSPGSYSEIKLGKGGETKKYPMKWLLDHTLLEVAGEGRWSKTEDNDSVWFRLGNEGKALRYPVELENCRYQIHVYQKQ